VHSDSAGCAIDCLDRLERYDQLVFPEPATADDDLVRTIGVALVAHTIDAPQLAPGGVEDSVTFGRGQQPSQFAQCARARAAGLIHVWEATTPPRRKPAARDRDRATRTSAIRA
jgi:hypothetical protein